MLRSLLILLLINGSVMAQANRKVLFIGVDGCRYDGILFANTPTIDSLQNTATFAGTGLCAYKTWSGNGWSSMLTGTWHTKHGVTDNTFIGANFAQYPDFIKRLETYNSNLRTVSVVHWAPINNIIIQAADNEINVGTDLEVKNNCITVLNTDNPDVLFVDFDDVDHAGHTFGFSPAIPEYLDAIEITDGYIGEILTALQNRPNYVNEDWLVIITTDHGGIPAGHGGGTLEERRIFNIFSNKNFPRNEILYSSYANVTNYVESQFPAGIYATPLNPTPFNFGTSGDFTIEFWVKPQSYTSDPALISNKNWNSGLNPGFVISAQSGQYWKVNVGDGADRLDIQGGYLNPGTWTHIAVSFDRDGLMTAYENGIVVGFEKMQAIGNLTTAYPLVINQDGTTTYGLNFSGAYKDIRIWGAALPENVINSWAPGNVNPLHPYYGQLLANWQLGDTIPDTIRDASPNANHLLLSGNINQTGGMTHNFVSHNLSDAPKEPDNAVTALTWMCVPIDSNWGLDGKSWVPECQPLASQSPLPTAKFTVTPNPTTGIATCQLPEPLILSGEWTLSHINGQKIMAQKIPAGSREFIIDLSELPTGIYLIEFLSGDTHHSQRVQVVRP